MVSYPFNPDAGQFEKLNRYHQQQIKQRDFYIEQITLIEKSLAHFNTPVESITDLILRYYVLHKNQKAVVEELRARNLRTQKNTQYMVTDVSEATLNANSSNCSCAELIQLAHLMLEDSRGKMFDRKNHGC